MENCETPQAMETKTNGCCQAMKTLRKTDTLKYHGNLSTETVDAMKVCRRMFIELSGYVESLGSSRELSEAFTHIETAQMYAIKHLCMVDPQAILEEV